MKFPYEPAITLSDVYPREVETCLWKTGTQIFTGTLSVLGKDWYPPKYPSMGGRLVKQMEYVIQLSAIVRQQIMYTSNREPAMCTHSSVARWGIMLSAKSQAGCIAVWIYSYNLQNDRSYRRVDQIEDCQGQGTGGGWEGTKKKG